MAPISARSALPLTADEVFAQVRDLGSVRYQA
jgi:hypothetical protein